MSVIARKAQLTKGLVTAKTGQRRTSRPNERTGKTDGKDGGEGARDGTGLRGQASRTRNWSLGEERANETDVSFTEIITEFSKTDRRHQTIGARSAINPKRNIVGPPYLWVLYPQIQQTTD